MTEIKDSFYEKEESDQSLLSAIFLISGTCIGAGMLALPFVTSIAGFYPSVISGFICWLFMMVTGLLFLETTLWLPDGANVLSITKTFLGKSGEMIAGVTFLFLYYCLLVSYIDEGSALFSKLLEFSMGFNLNTYASNCIFTFAFGLMVLWGTKLVSHINWLFVLALGTSYALLIGTGSQTVESSNLGKADWRLWIFAAPTLFSAYGYHNIIPTLSTYMKRDAKKLRLAIIIGTTIPFVVYTLWQWVVMGSISAENLAFAVDNNLRSYDILASITHNPWIGVFGGSFAIFAIITSLLGVSLSMVDFLGDGLGIKRSGFRRIVLCLLVFVPPLLFATYNPGIFIQAIGIAGGIGESILNGIIPISMFWIGKYHLNKESSFSLPGGRISLTLLMLFTIFIMGLEIYHLI
ncbi:MAG: aromatic amino acid transport family protein [Chlamydiota bacterium]|nr:aromatic amino acid transport family protein [Chlamydiota bacterium]